MSHAEPPPEPPQPELDADYADLAGVVSQSSTPRQIADHIMASIAVGALPEGTCLPPERRLADELEVSRSSVRAALATLERQGFVVRRRGRGGGTFIAHVEPARVEEYSARLAEFRQSRRDLLDARAIVQNRVAAVAARRREAADIARLRELADEYARAGSAAAARTADARFHHAMAQAARNPLLAEIAADLDGRINAGFRHDPFSERLFEQAAADHRGLVEAIAAGDPETAGELCETHFRTTTMGGQ
ncbi:FadR/GntR family transcriptional regulator [Brevibacterium album]|uniref:FadR/GntR family transcriptional regulator n=1 Tax=Brevibacterium album TaxID=417948 RepID=UPI0004072147|nr:FCD domain-containing protein [Brevibacterium album]